MKNPIVSLAGNRPKARYGPRYVTRVLRYFARALTIACLLSVANTASATDPDKVEWSRDWPRIRVLEGLNIVALTFGSYAVSEHWKPVKVANFRGGWLFDEAVRDGLRGRTSDVQNTFLDVGDYLYKGAVLAPYIIDSYIVALGIHQSADVAIEMTLINLQALGTTGVVTIAVERASGRARPYTDQCQPDGTTRDSAGRTLANGCYGDQDNQSFYSGHAAAVATMAGLTCVHHQHLPLYGGGFADLAPCLVMMTAATATGVSRIVGDRHWSTDVLMGWGVGALSGYVLPSLLHYGFGGGHPLGELKTVGARVIPLPQVYTGGAGLGLTGVF
ncbi:phosphatase PAP2 family protein [Pendulispora albinea]|uniref:Phosphatase PAP2 family protein n=1 Tax=Pendulispora albinea TaxID=2741071 RepID=A0ABZ2LXR6_9BACT